MKTMLDPKVIGAAGGGKRSARKTDAARANGAKGGRPSKAPDQVDVRDGTTWEVRIGARRTKVTITQVYQDPTAGEMLRRGVPKYLARTHDTKRVVIVSIKKLRAPGAKSKA